MDNFFTFLGQHWILSTLFVVLLIAIIAFEMMNKKEGGDSLGAQEAVGLMNRDDAVVLDIRKRDAFVRGHIINAVHIPLAQLQKDIRKIQEHKKKPIIVVCADGLESAKAAKIISENEFDQVKILRGGIKAWREEKLPLEKG